MNRIKQIEEDILSGNAKPIYFLMGDEPYYIDKITNFIEKNALPEEQRDFNQLVLYGRDVEMEDIVSYAKKYPMMAEKQVVIVKEAQHLARQLDNLLAYAENPLETTILVLSYKYKKPDKRKKILKLIAKNGCLFESKKLYDNQVGEWIINYLNDKGYKVEIKAAHMLNEFIGSDLSKLANELDKLTMIVPKGTVINADHIEANIGISKDFNNFELRKALGEKDLIKANRIINYFAQNPKNNPLVVTVAQLHSFFSNLLIYHGLKDKGRINAGKVLNTNPYFIQEYERAVRNYPMRKVSQIIGYLRDADMTGKGVGVSRSSQGDILKELIFKILH